MKDHETIITKPLKEERNRLQKEEWDKASLFDKAFSFLILLAVVVIIASPIYVIFQLIKLYWK